MIFQRARLGVLRRLTVAVAVVVALLGWWTPSGKAQSAVTRRVNVPYLGPTAPAADFIPAIFWFGNVSMTNNYADVRVFYFDEHIKFVFHITDRLLWHASAPTASTLTAWDAVSLYVDLAGNAGQTPQATSHWFVKQLGNTASASSRTAYRGNGSGWTPSSTTFRTTDSWRGNYPNDTVWDMGWVAEFEIPFSSLGLSGPPPPGTRWGLGVRLHDRDEAGTVVPDQFWPETMQPVRPDTWGQLQFGRPVYTPPTPTVAGTTTVRHGLNGAVVPDAAVGGHTVCGDPMNAWTEWGNKNYAGNTQFNIQNQWDISDFMCFSKYYVTFPLSSVPAGKAVVSARVSLDRFGNPGYAPGDSKPSAINAFIVSQDWSESTVTWNNAPYAAENVSVTWVNAVDSTHPPGAQYWDVSYAVAEAYRTGTPLRLAFYSTDGEYHSGKYFWTSDSNDWNGVVRPTLEVRWGNASTSPPPLPPTNVRIIKVQ